MMPRLLDLKLSLCLALYIKEYRGRGGKVRYITHVEEDDKLEVLAADRNLPLCGRGIMESGSVLDVTNFRFSVVVRDYF
jgi:hypothetical protein